MNAAIKIDITKCPVPRLAPSYPKRVKVADSFDRYLMRESERRERLYNWEKPQPSESKPRRGVKPSIWTPRRTAELIRNKMRTRKMTYRALADKTGIPLRTLQDHIANPDRLNLGEVRAIHNRLIFTTDELASLGRGL